MKKEYKLYRHNDKRKIKRRGHKRMFVLVSSTFLICVFGTTLVKALERHNNKEVVINGDNYTVTEIKTAAKATNNSIEITNPDTKEEMVLEEVLEPILEEDVTPEQVPEVVEVIEKEIIPEIHVEENNDYFDLTTIGIDTSFKAYMDYRTITNTTSMQYQLQQEAYTDEYGFRRIGNDYMVALGTRFAKSCGERFQITLDSGVTFTVVVGDIKQDIHTDATNTYRSVSNGKGNVVEFIIDKEVMPGAVLSLGTISSLGFEGNVSYISRLGLEQTNDLSF